MFRGMFADKVPLQPDHCSLEGTIERGFRRLVFFHGSTSFGRRGHTLNCVRIRLIFEIEHKSAVSEAALIWFEFKLG
jgi:hypothetical protein